MEEWEEYGGGWIEMKSNVMKWNDKFASILFFFYSLSFNLYLFI
jgi:hypothetical protein